MTTKLFFWKLSFITALVLWCYASVSPIQDRPFEDFIQSQVSYDSEAFETLLESSRERVRAGQSPTLFIALRDLGRESGTDYAVFFPDINLTDIPNRDKRKWGSSKSTYSLKHRVICV